MKAEGGRRKAESGKRGLFREGRREWHSTIGRLLFCELPWHKDAMALAPSLERTLKSAKTERPLLRCFKKNPSLLAHGLTSVPFGKYVSAEFPFGSDYKADFVVLCPFSGGWDIHFVELEPANVPLFTKAGNPARRLAGAIAQIDSWRTFAEKNRECVLRELSKFVQRRELVWGRNREPTDNCGWHLYDPRSHLNFRFDIVIGRSSKLDDHQLGRKAAYRANHNVEVMTYDRILRAAKRLDAWEDGLKVEHDDPEMW